MASKTFKISVVITNYNYQCFIGQAIESVLSQSLPVFETIVVDDGSEDGSRAILEHYAENENVSVIFKENGGQASAFNAGFAAACGDLVWFLDADDYALPGALDEVHRCWSPGAAKLHSQLEVVDANGNSLDARVPSRSFLLAHGEIKRFYLVTGKYSSPPTSGTVYSREALSMFFPIPEDDYRICADGYLKLRSAFEGKILKTSRPIGAYRLHGDNNYFQKKDLSPYSTLITIKRIRNKYCFLATQDRSTVTRILRSIFFLSGKQSRFFWLYNQAGFWNEFETMFGGTALFKIIKFLFRWKFDQSALR